MRTLFLVCVLAVFGFVASIPVYVMLPLDTITNDNTLKNPSQLQNWFNQLSKGGVDGVMADVWWGIVEYGGPQQYNWTAYKQLTHMVNQSNLKMEATMSFHKCGGNVGDTCDIPLPPWVGGGVFYKDKEGNVDDEYLSLGVDTEDVFPGGRSAVDMYVDFMKSFSDTFDPYIGNVIVEVQVGLGPAGEMRYPSYRLAGGLWSFPGIGEFQCYDDYMLSSLMKAAEGVGHPEWGHGGPINAGTYKDYPSNTPFFSDWGTDNYNSDYGKFFLKWYSSQLINHGQRVLMGAKKVFGSSGVRIAAKVAGIHWWYMSSNHAAELTAGYYNLRTRDGYRPIVDMFASLGVAFDFTCLEMRDSEQSGCDCGPEELVRQTIQDSNQARVEYEGENALPRYDQSAYDEIYKESTQYGRIAGFTYLRMCSDLMDNNNNWNRFVNFVAGMH